VRLRSLDGEAGAGEAPGAAVEGAAALLHPPPDRGEVGGGGGRRWLWAVACDWERDPGRERRFACPLMACHRLCFVFMLNRSLNAYVKNM
jgi:hypothetical protein